MEGVPPDTYLERFAWNEAKYPPRRPLKETVAAITETAQKLEDELKACPAFLKSAIYQYFVCLSCRLAHCTLWRKAVQPLHASWQAENIEESMGQHYLLACVCFGKYVWRACINLNNKHCLTAH